MKSLPYIPLSQAQINCARHEERSIKERGKNKKKRKVMGKFKEYYILYDINHEEIIKDTVVVLAEYIIDKCDVKSALSNVKHRIIMDSNTGNRVYRYYVKKAA